MKLLIVTHSLCRTGATKALLDRIVNDLSIKYTEINVLSLAGGDMLAEYKDQCHWVISPPVHGRLSRIFYKRLVRRSLDLICRYVLKMRSGDVVLINTLVPLGFLNNKNMRSFRVFVWAHELAQSVGMYCQPNWHLAIPHAKFIAASEPVRRYLDNHGLDVAPDSVLPLTATHADCSEVHDDANTYILGIGGPSWHKGTDYFLQVAHKCQSRSHLQFVWIGGNVDSFEHRAFQIEASRLNLKNILFVPSTTDMQSWYCSAVGILVLSREESFGLPIVEAGLLGVPTIAWKGDDGPTWIIDQTDGYTVQYGDCDQVCNLVYALDDSHGMVSGRSILHEKMVEFVRSSRSLSDYLIP